MSAGARKHEIAGGGTVFAWTAEGRELTAQLWAKGWSAGQIAKELGGGISRNAVIGIIHRAGLSGRNTASVPTRAKVIPLPKGPRPKAQKATKPAAGHIKPNPHENRLNTALANAAAKLAPLPLDRAKAFTPLPGSEPRPFMERPRKGCSWPVGGSGADMLCCAIQRDGEGPYCVSHAQVARAPNQPKTHAASSRPSVTRRSA